MKANELMVGDWVLWKNKPVQVASVSGVKYSFGHIDVTLAHCNDEKLLETHDIKSIRPIPLTPEILEKNGFTDWMDHSRTTRSCSMLVDKTNIIVQKIDGADYIFTQIHRVGADSCEFRMGLKYVHELQHALRLCRIEKTIEL